MDTSAPKSSWLSQRASRFGVVLLVVAAVLPPLGLLIHGGRSLPLHDKDIDHLELQTTSASELLFTNMRRFAYELSSDDSDALRRYRLKLGTDVEPSHVRWEIAHWWKAGRAGIVARLSKSAAALDVSGYLCEVEQSSSSWSWQIDAPSQAATTAARMYRCLAQDGQLSLLGQGKQLKIWSSPEQIRQAKRVFRDYFALIEAI